MAEAKFSTEKPKHHKFIDLTGRVFGRLTVVEFAYQNKYSFWHCDCSCGEKCIKPGPELTRKNRKGCESCGCLSTERRLEKSTTHGMSRTPEWNSWSSMRKRCYDKNNGSYKRYGLRGISVDPKWRDSFEQFYKDMGPRPSPSHSLDRKDNNGNYTPSNCRWATAKQQLNNTSLNRMLTHNGVTKTVAEWVGSSKVNEYSRVLMRLNDGWCDSCALTAPLNSVCPHK